MPCYDNRDEKVVYVASDKATEREKHLEAMLCAVFNELERVGIAHAVAGSASRSGLIDVIGFYSQHKKDDKTRLITDIHKRYSLDEIELIKQMLNEIY